MAGYRNRYERKDEEWEQVKDSLPSELLQKQGRLSKPNRQILNAILWIAKSGAAWRDLLERYGAWQTVYGKFKKWSANGIFENIFQR